MHNLDRQPIGFFSINNNKCPFETTCVPYLRNYLKNGITIKKSLTLTMCNTYFGRPTGQTGAFFAPAKAQQSAFNATLRFHPWFGQCVSQWVQIDFKEPYFLGAKPSWKIETAKRLLLELSWPI